MSRFRVALALAAVLAAALAATPASAEPVIATYEVTITNLTDGGQWLTPPLIATHKGSDGLFDLGKEATFGLKEIAENGNLGPMLARIDGDEDFFDHAVAVSPGPGPLPPGGSVEVTVTAQAPHNFASWASMLICTNDGFTGVDTIHLPKRVGESVTMRTDAYDAGTEVNTEDFADIVPPCPVLSGVTSEDPGVGTSDPALGEGGVIHHHAGIQGIDDLVVAVHGWSEPVGEITIVRTG